MDTRIAAVALLLAALPYPALPGEDADAEKIAAAVEEAKAIKACTHPEVPGKAPVNDRAKAYMKLSHSLRRIRDQREWAIKSNYFKAVEAAHKAAGEIARAEEPTIAQARALRAAVEAVRVPQWKAQALTGELKPDAIKADLATAESELAKAKDAAQPTAEIEAKISTLREKLAAVEEALAAIGDGQF